MDIMGKLMESGLFEVSIENITKFGYLQLKRKIISDYTKASTLHLENERRFTKSDSEEILNKVLSGYQDMVVNFVKAALKKKEQNK